MMNTTSLALGFMLVGAFGATAMADSQKVVDVNNVQGVIAKTHAGWRAKETWVSRLSKAEARRMLGLKTLPQGRLDFTSVGRDGTSIDWRNVNGVNWLGPVMNQGNCGSCVAFATVATLEAQTSISAGLPWLHPSYSPQMLFACGGAGCETGWQPDSAADFLKSTGITDEACMPYTEGSTGEDAACNQKCSDADSRTTKIANSSTPSNYGGSADEVKAALKKGPLATTLVAYADFMTYSSGVYKHVTGAALGGHAVSLVGYDDSKNAWLIRNSWGPEWGDHGFAWVNYDDISGIGANTWAFEMGTSAGFLSIQSPTDREFVSGQYQLVAQVEGNRVGSVQFHIKDQAGREISNIACAAAADTKSCAAQLDTTTLKEGRYEISADNGTTLKSQVREFFVINSEPKLSMSFTPAPGVDLTQPQKDRPEFMITAQSGSAVPIQHIEFRAIDMSGKIASVKTNDYVLEHMKMGWRTMTVADGQYKILFHGETTYKGKAYSADSDSVTITVKN